MFYIVFGFILGLLCYFSYNSMYLGEIILLGVLLLSTFRFKFRDIKKKSIIISFVAFSIIIVIESLIMDVEKSEIAKYFFKYMMLSFEIYLFNKSFMIRPKNTVLLLISFLFGWCEAVFFQKYGIAFDVRLLHVLPIAIILPVYNIFYDDFNGKKTVNIVLTVVLFALAFISRSRTNMVIIACYVAVYLFLKIIKSSKYKSKPNAFIRNISLIVVLLFCSIVFFNFIDNNISQSTKSNDERRMLIDVSLREFQDSPLFGIGVNNFRSYSYANYNYYIIGRLTPHNIFLEVLAENGIVGFIAFMMPYIIVFVYVIKSRKSNYYLLLTFLVFFFFFNTFSTSNRFLFSIVMSVFCYLMNNNAESKDYIKEKNDDKNINCRNV